MRLPTRRESREMRRHGRTWEGSRWKCIRHRAPDEVLSLDNHTRQLVLTCVEVSHGRYWSYDGEKPSNGFVWGPGFKAFAKDFAPGTKITVTATIAPPQSLGPGPDGRNRECLDCEKLDCDNPNHKRVPF